MKDPEEGMVIKYIEYNKIAEVCALLTKNPHLRYSRRKYDDASTLLVWILSSHKLFFLPLPLSSPPSSPPLPLPSTTSSIK